MNEQEHELYQACHSSTLRNQVETVRVADIEAAVVALREMYRSGLVVDDAEEWDGSRDVWAYGPDTDDQAGHVWRLRLIGIED